MALDYFDHDQLEAEVAQLVAAHPRWLAVETIGTSIAGRPILLLTLGDRHGAPEEQPALWLDAGTHAVEWTGVVSAMASVRTWLQGLSAGDSALCAEFARSTVYVVPCVSPDGLQETMHGSPAFRSSLRPPRGSGVRSGFDPCDLDGDGRVGWMRWRHPAGSWVPASVEGGGEHPFLMRPRHVDDDPAHAYFLCEEGRFVNWDGVRWVAASTRYGMDLNRNFPVDWAPFSMFGSDSGAFPLSEPESRALMDAVVARPNIAAALTNHTYTGCLLCPPGRPDSPLPSSDVAMMHRLARDLVQGTGYRVFKVHPEFTYDPAHPIIGTWDDTLSTTLGICAYTLELWDPYAWAGVDAPAPIDMFRDPSQAQIEGIASAVVRSGAYQPWRSFKHPQLGAVELGGFDYRRTLRNPPVSALGDECEQAHRVVDRLRRALPRVELRLEVEPLGEATRVVAIVENLGALSTSSLLRGVAVGSPAVICRLQLNGPERVAGIEEQELDQLPGWYGSLHGFGRNPLYPGLGPRGGRAMAEWILRGSGEVAVQLSAGRAGVLHATVTV